MNANEKENAYYANIYQCINNNVDWVDKYGTHCAYNCDCGGKTIPIFEVTNKIKLTQCKSCYKYHRSNGETFHTCG